MPAKLIVASAESLPRDSSARDPSAHEKSLLRVEDEHYSRCPRWPAGPLWDRLVGGASFA